VDLFQRKGVIFWDAQALASNINRCTRKAKRAFTQPLQSEEDKGSQNERTDLFLVSFSGVEGPDRIL